ncbi:MAG: hypothetical protein AAGE01_12590 [Pseudomonadota bacterium]
MRWPMTAEERRLLLSGEVGGSRRSRELRLADRPAPLASEAAEGTLPDDRDEAVAGLLDLQWGRPG